MCGGGWGTLVYLYQFWDDLYQFWDGLYQLGSDWVDLARFV